MQHSGGAVRLIPDENLLEGRRHHADINGRAITLLRHAGKVVCIDRRCSHISGPLGEDGEIEELGGMACIKCPWHCRRFDLASGRRVETDLYGGVCLSDAVEQRVHPTHVDGERWIWAVIEDEPPVLSDKNNTTSKQPTVQSRGPGWGYGLGGTSQTAADVSEPSYESLSPPQPLTPYAGVERRPLTPSPAKAYEPLSTVFPGQKMTAAVQRRKQATQAIMLNAIQPPVVPVKQPASRSGTSGPLSRGGLLQTDLRTLFGRQSQSQTSFSQQSSQSQHSQLTTDMEF